MFKLFICAAILAVACADHINKNAQVRTLINEVHEDGSYKYNFDTSNGISQQESGFGGQGSSGVAQWVSPEGVVVQLTYTADANGYHPQGTHIPTPPPVPAAILRALEWARLNPTPEEALRRQQQQF